MSEASDAAVPLSRSPVSETPGHPAFCRDGAETPAETVDLKALARLVLARDARRDSNQDGVSRGPRTREKAAGQSVSMSHRAGQSETTAHFTASDSLENRLLAAVSLSRVPGSGTTETGGQNPTSVEIVAKDGDDENATSLAPSWTEAAAERAAIVEHDGKIPRAWAEGYARLHPDHPPGDVPLRRWQTFVDDCGRFLDASWGDRVRALNWGPLDLFGCDRERPFARIDHAGLLWLLNGDKLIELDRHTALIERPTGARQTFRRRPVAVGEIVLAWELVS